MTGMWSLCNLPAPLEDPERVEATASSRARRAARHRPVALAAVGGGVGGGRPALLRPLLHAADPAAGAAGRRRVRTRQPRRGRSARSRSRSVVGVRVLGRRVLLPSGRAGAELPVGVALPRRPPRTPTTRSTCGAACPRSTGRRAVVPATRFLTSSFLTGNYPGRPPAEANTGDDTEAAWDDFYDGLHRAPAASTSSTRHRPRSAARSTTRSPSSRASSRSSTRSTRYVVTIDGIDVYKRK